jgi:hypothetical protein
MEPDVALVAGLVARFFPAEDAAAFVRGQSIPNAEEVSEKVQVMRSFMLRALLD